MADGIVRLSPGSFLLTCAAVAAVGCGGSTTTVINRTVTRATQSPSTRTGFEAAQPSVLCLNDQGSAYGLKREPVKCAHFGANGANAGGFVLNNLQWTGWGQETARAHGVECGFHLPCAKLQATVTVGRPTVVCGNLIYTRWRETTKYGHFRTPVDQCPGTKALANSASRGGRGSGTKARRHIRQTSAAPGSTADCGDLATSGAGIYDVQATNIDCNLARRIAMEWGEQCVSQRSGGCTVYAGYSCKSSVQGEELSVITCGDGDRVAKFSFGA